MPEPVAETVREVLAVAGLLDDAPRGGVDFGAGHARGGAFDRRALRLEDDRPDLAVLVGRLAEPGRAGDVVVVAVGLVPGVDQHRLVLRERRRARRAVGKGGGRAELHDVLAAERGRDVGLEGARPERREGLPEAGERDRDGPPHHLDLVGRLDHPERREEARAGDRLPAGAGVQEPLHVVVGRRRLDGERAGARRERGPRPSPRGPRSPPTSRPSRRPTCLAGGPPRRPDRRRPGPHPGRERGPSDVRSGGSRCRSGSRGSRKAWHRVRRPEPSGGARGRFRGAGDRFHGESAWGGC